MCNPQLLYIAGRDHAEPPFIVFYQGLPQPRAHSRTQSPSYARCDEGLWPNPYSKLASDWLVLTPDIVFLPCFYGIRLWIWPEPLVAPRVRRALGTRMPRATTRKALGTRLVPDFLVIKSQSRTQSHRRRLWVRDWIKSKMASSVPFSILVPFLYLLIYGHVSSCVVLFLHVWISVFNIRKQVQKVKL
jgi:hypothetical protein